MQTRPPSMRPPRRGGFPAGPDLLGSGQWLMRFFDDPVEWSTDLHAQYGDLVGLRVGGMKLVVCFDPDILERMLVREPRSWVKGDGLRATRFVLGNGLITADGEEHRRHRALAAPVFTPRNIEPFAEATVAIANEVLDTWPQEGVQAVAEDCYDISLRVAGVGLFGSDFDAPERAQLRTAMHDMDRGYRLAVGPGGRAATTWWPIPQARRMRQGRDHVRDVIGKLVAQRRAAEDTTRMGDLLSRLLEARGAAEDGGTGFSDEQLRDEAVTMLLAGHDTTAATLTWCLAMLALHPAEQDRAVAEVDELLAGRAAEAGDLRALPIVRSVVEETMRLHPVIYSMVRDAVEPVELPGGYVLHPGTDVSIPIGALHRDVRWWDEPLQFRPERFLDQAANRARPKVAYIPFGTGPRVCIGSSFAMQELVLVLATVLQRYRISAPPGFQLEPYVGFLRRPAGPVPLQVTRRPDIR